MVSIVITIVVVMITIFIVLMVTIVIFIIVVIFVIRKCYFLFRITAMTRQKTHGVCFVVSFKDMDVAQIISQVKTNPKEFTPREYGKH